ncbi:hypothetical protein D3C78_1133940 [compost metagenome]
MQIRQQTARHHKNHAADLGKGLLQAEIALPRRTLEIIAHQRRADRHDGADRQTEKGTPDEQASKTFGKKAGHAGKAVKQDSAKQQPLAAEAIRQHTGNGRAESHENRGQCQHHAAHDIHMRRRQESLLDGRQRRCDRGSGHDGERGDEQERHFQRGGFFGHSHAPL